MIKIQNRAKVIPGVREVKTTCPLCGKEIVTTGNQIIYVRTQREDEYWIHRKCFEKSRGKCQESSE